MLHAGVPAFQPGRLGGADRRPGAGGPRAPSRSRRPPRRSPTRSPRSSPQRPAGLARAAADLDGRPRAAPVSIPGSISAAAAGRDRLPVLARRPGRGAGARGGPGRARWSGSGTTVSVLAPGRGRHRGAGVRHAGRALGGRALQRVGGAGDVRPGHLRAGAALARRARPFDVLHLHEPTTVSVSVLALLAAEGPIVATFHTSTERSRALAAFGGVLRPLMEKVTARIAVSPHGPAGAGRAPRRRRRGDPERRRRRRRSPQGRRCRGTRGRATVGFLGRFDEPRKGMPVLLDAVRALAPSRPDLRLLVVGSGDVAALRRQAGPVADRLDVLGPVDDATKAAALRSVDVFCAPNTGGRELRDRAHRGAGRGGAGAGQRPRRVPRRAGGGRPAGVLFPTGDAGRARRAAGRAARRPGPPSDRSRPPVGCGRATFDWPVVAARCSGSTGRRSRPTRGGWPRSGERRGLGAGRRRRLRAGGPHRAGRDPGPAAGPAARAHRRRPGRASCGAGTPGRRGAHRGRGTRGA